METGIKEARQIFPQLIKLAEQGETVVLTRHGRKVAKIVPYREARSGCLQARADLRSRIKASGEPLSKTIDAMREARR